MKVTVKILKGSECTIQLSEHDTVLRLKEHVNEQLSVPVNAQRLVHRGKPLPDGRTLKECGVFDRTKLFLVVKKDETESTSGSPSRLCLWDELHYFLLKHFQQGDAKVVLEQFKQDFNRMVHGLSLDDIERMAKSNLEQKEASPS